jgi:hypothetical protein
LGRMVLLDGLVDDHAGSGQRRTHRSRRSVGFLVPGCSVRIPPRPQRRSAPSPAGGIWLHPPDRQTVRSTTEVVRRGRPYERIAMDSCVPA